MARVNAVARGAGLARGANGSSRLGVFSPEIFLPLFVLGFYGTGLLLVDFSLRALVIVAIGVGAYLIGARLTGRFIESRRDAGPLAENYFERLLVSLVAVFVIDLALKGFVPVVVRAPVYLTFMAALFYALGRRRVELSGAYYAGLGLAMILIYVVPSFALYGLYGTYLNRTGGLMPAFLVGVGTITTIYGLMKVSSGLSRRGFFVLAGVITLIAGPLMAAAIGYRAYAIIYIMPLIFQYYLERTAAGGDAPRAASARLKSGLAAIGVVVVLFVYTYFATSATRGVIYMHAPLDSPRAPAYVVSSMKSGHYTDKDVNLANEAAKSKIITRPLFTYGVFLDVIDSSYPWGKSHGKLTVSLMPGVTKGRSTTISILKKPLSTSFFGLPFLEFGFAGVVAFALALGLSLATASRLRDPKTYALILTIIMLWLDTGPSVWWHWLPFAASLVAFGALLLGDLVHPKAAGLEDRP